MESGIYQIRNVLTNEKYIGSAKDFRIRENAHYSLLERNKHHSVHLQNAYNKYGKENFVFEILEFISNPINLVKYEQLYLNEYKPEYNICTIAGSRLGTAHSENTKSQISKSRIDKGYWKHSDNPRFTLSSEQIDEIRIKYKTNKYTQTQLAVEYGVGQQTISKIVLNQRRLVG